MVVLWKQSLLGDVYEKMCAGKSMIFLADFNLYI